MSEELQLTLRCVDVVEAGRHALEGYDTCEIGSAIELDPRKLATYCSGEWQPIIYDALLVCAAAEYCDRRYERPARGWGRHFRVRVPVHEPARWADPAVLGSLLDALGKLTGDRWEFTFTQRESDYPEIHQSYLHWPQPSSVILPFSDGMDSRAVATLLRNDNLVLVRLGRKQVDRPKVNGRRQAFTTVPYAVPGRDFPETSGRARGFKFAMVSALAAYLSGSKRIVVPESGQGALGPVLAGHRYGDYRSHPIFLRKVERFVRALLGVDVAFDFPQLWRTKGQTLRAAIAEVSDVAWRETRSCWQPSTQMSADGEKRQCGYCAACMLRRLSVHAAGETEAPKTYMLEDLSAPTLEEGLAKAYDRTKNLGEAQQSYGVAGSLHLDHLASLQSSKRQANTLERQLRELAHALGESAESVEQNARAMLSEHEAEWRAFLGSLSPDSFIRQRSMRLA
jgi:7-cyano-7-deazaguanine synthase in queuosine biosynthesis